MKSWCFRAAGLALVFLAGGAAQAVPLGFYRFKVSEIACMQRLGDPAAVADQCQQEQAFFAQKLESITFVAPLVDGPRTFGLHLETDVLPPASVEPKISIVNGISAVDLSAWGVPLDLDRGLCLSSWRCFVEADFASDGGPLTGLFRLGTSNDDILMKTTGTSFLWSGYVTSDGPYLTGGRDNSPTFSGYWRVVPEPGTLALLLVPLLFLAARRAGSWSA